jgi:hypothetical protein
VYRICIQKLHFQSWLFQRSWLAANHLPWIFLKRSPPLVIISIHFDMGICLHSLFVKRRVHTNLLEQSYCSPISLPLKLFLCDHFAKSMGSLKNHIQDIILQQFIVSTLSTLSTQFFSVGKTFMYLDSHFIGQKYCLDHQTWQPQAEWLFVASEIAIFVVQGSNHCIEII